MKLLFKLLVACMVTIACAEEKMKENIDFKNKFQASPFFFNGKNFAVKKEGDLSKHEEECHKLIQTCFDSLEGKLKIKPLSKAFIENKNVNGENVRIIYLQNFLEKGERGSDYSVAIYLNEEGDIINILSGS